MNRSAFSRNFRTHVEVELLEALLLLEPIFRVEPAGYGEYGEQEQGESDAGNRCDLFGEQVGYCDQEKNKGRHEQADRDFSIAYPDVQRRFVLLVVALESQHKNTKRLHEETPHH